MDTASVKEQVWALAAELNAVLGASLVQPCQQKTAVKKISLTGLKDERLYIKPANGRYMIALSGNSLVARMETYMGRLTGCERHGYCHPQTGREPYWYVNDYAQVRAAAYFFAGATSSADVGQIAGAMSVVHVQPVDEIFHEAEHQPVTTVLPDGPRALRDLTARAARQAKINAPHIAPLTEYVSQLRSQHPS
ncbi:hypothetical protein C7401_1602 [Paraburkholderia unamae]|uniref:hypothetical protein n=1 Tax=Paraburkholderia unamae TaxID=219649 RepID=UPI000DC326A1|nr:hypothetical protein [Paraburkholderia unamae]RAR47686.1 hypothetical protein C7401_1602 [Paraburkholderia unamae]